MSGHAEQHSDKLRAALYVVATPIGNLKDITLRALEVLRSVDVVYAEDTRTSATLLAHHGIRTSLRSLHEHNEARATQEVLRELEAGRAVALISDAGTPAISDPGALVVAAAREAGHRIVPVPGPNAAIAALSVSGISGPFLFVGFLPAKASARRKLLEGWRSAPYALVFYEAPHRVAECVEDLLAVYGPGRTLTIARELTKLYESVHVCPLGEAPAWLAEDANRLRGEFVLIVSPAAADADATRIEGERVLKLLREALPLKDAARLAAAITGARKNELYELGLRGQAE